MFSLFRYFRIYMKRGFTVIFIIPLVVLMVLYLNSPKIENTKIIINEPKIVYENHELFQKIKNIASSSFIHYIRNCKGSSEVKSNSAQCLNNSFFAATLIESLEVLQVLKLKDLFNMSKEWIVSNYQCENLSWIGVFDFWERVVGSLIGSYILSKDKLFLEMADKCAKQAIGIIEGSSKYPSFLNFDKRISKLHSINNYSLISNIVAGLPEIMTLYRETQDILYYNYIEKVVLILNNETKEFPLFWGDQGNQTKKYLYNAQEPFLDFVDILTVSNMINQSEIIGKLIEKTLSEKNTTFKYLIPKMLFTLSNVQHMGLNLSMINHSFYESQYNQNQIFKPNERSRFPPNYGYINCYRFETYKLNLLLANRSASPYYKKKILDQLDFSRDTMGFSGICSVNSIQNILDHVQHSQFFSDLLMKGSLYSVSHSLIENMPESLILNRFGHILYLNQSII